MMMLIKASEADILSRKLFAVSTPNTFSVSSCGCSTYFLHANVWLFASFGMHGEDEMKMASVCLSHLIQFPVSEWTESFVATVTFLSTICSSWVCIHRTDVVCGFIKFLFS